jgi:hypothetical protein
MADRAFRSSLVPRSPGRCGSAAPAGADRRSVTMSPMKEKRMSTKRADSPRADRTSEDGKRKEAEPRPETRRRVRKIVERHRETFDELAK